MPSKLIITSTGTLQRKVISTVKSLQKNKVVFVSLNKPRKSVEKQLKQAGVNTKGIFFIDCVNEEDSKDDVLHVPPDRLDLLDSAIKTYVKTIKSEPAIVIDSLSTLMIYNNENDVAQFAKRLTDFTSETKATVIALSPNTKKEELLNKIFNFFDEVKK